MRTMQFKTSKVLVILLGTGLLLCMVFLYLHKAASNDRSSIEVRNNAPQVINNAPELTSNAPLMKGLLEPDESKCVSGYLKGFPPACGEAGCLRVLRPPAKKTESLPMSEEHVKAVIATKGYMHPVQINFTYYMTRAQRDLGVYGSVGEIGVYHGMFTAVMANWLDRDAGERVFICDLFGEGPHMKLKTVSGANKKAFEATMNKFGFSLSAVKEENLVRVWDQSSLYLFKSHFVKMDLPAFRLFSVDGNHINPFPLADMVLVSCIMHEGGVMAIDDYLHGRPYDVIPSVKRYSEVYGKALLPLAIIERKLYMVPTEWYPKYKKWFEDNKIPEVMNMKSRTGLGFDTEFYHIPA